MTRQEICKKLILVEDTLHEIWGETLENEELLDYYIGSAISSIDSALSLWSDEDD